MPLQHTHEHEEPPAPLSAFATNAPQETRSEAAPLSARDGISWGAPRYDAATVKQIIALAEQMQTHHRQTLTPDEIEALGYEVGVEPQFIRRALAQIEAQPGSVKRVKTPHREKRGLGILPIPHRPLSRRQVSVVLLTSILYALLVPCTFSWFADGDTAALTARFVALPALLAACMGIYCGSKRLGAAGGAFLGLVSVFTMMAYATFHQWHQTPFHQFVTVLQVWLATTITLGVTGAAARQIVSESFRRERLPVHSGAEQRPSSQPM